MGIPSIDATPWGTHFCHFYETKGGLLDLLVPYFKAGLENHEFCLWVTSDYVHETDAREAMTKAVPELDRYVQDGQIEFIPHTQWYLKDGDFNIQRVLQGWIEKYNQALASGYQGIRVTGDGTSTIASLGKFGWHDFVDYEQMADKAIRQCKMLVLCTYALDKCGATSVIDVVRHHQFALVERTGAWERIESAELKRAKAELAEREKADAVRVQLLDGVLTAQEEERKRIARELHDETVQSLMSLLVGLRTIQDSRTLQEAKAQAAHLRTLTSQAMKEVQRLAHGLRPSILDDMGLEDALKRHASDFTQTHGIAVEVEAIGFEGERLPTHIETTFFRIAQEALTNTVKHAAAKNVSILLNRSVSDIQMIVEDDGIGFEQDSDQKTDAPSIHLGLSGMRERVSMLGGFIAIELAPGKGIMIRVRVPLDRKTT